MCTHLENKVLIDKNSNVKIDITSEILDNIFGNKKFYNITNDYIFKKIFTKEKNLRYLLNKFFELKPRNIAIKNNELLKEYLESKAGIVDLFLELDNENVILELQNVNEYNIEERALFYSSCVIANHSLDKGQNFKELKPLKVLVILNYNYQDKQLEIANIMKNNKILTDKLEFKFFDLTKANQQDELVKLCNMNSFEDIEKFDVKLDIENKELLLDIVSDLKKFNESEDERKNMEDIARMMMEEKCYYENAYDAGINDNKEEVAFNMLEENMDINLISKLTKLSKDKILFLKNINNSKM